MTSEPDPLRLPADLPIPTDDGACMHLPGVCIPPITLLGIDGINHRLDQLAERPLILYVYPATGRPGVDPGPEWDSIPGAPGCTVQSLGFRDHESQFLALGYTVVGLSAQSSGEQREFATRQQIPFLLLSDPTFLLAEKLGLPTFMVEQRQFYKRLVLVLDEKVVRHAFYPVYPPNESANVVLTWLVQSRTTGQPR
jgi:peroxiredoxin